MRIDVTDGARTPDTRQATVDGDSVFTHPGRVIDDSSRFNVSAYPSDISALLVVEDDGEIDGGLPSVGGIAFDNYDAVDCDVHDDPDFVCDTHGNFGGNRNSADDFPDRVGHFLNPIVAQSPINADARSGFPAGQIPRVVGRIDRSVGMPMVNNGNDRRKEQAKKRQQDNRTRDKKDTDRDDIDLELMQLSEYRCLGGTCRRSTQKATWALSYRHACAGVVLGLARRLLQ